MHCSGLPLPTFPVMERLSRHLLIHSMYVCEGRRQTSQESRIYGTREEIWQKKGTNVTESQYKWLVDHAKCHREDFWNHWVSSSALWVGKVERSTSLSVSFFCFPPSHWLKFIPTALPSCSGSVPHLPRAKSQRVSSSQLALIVEALDLWFLMVQWPMN